MANVYPKGIYVNQSRSKYVESSVSVNVEKFIEFVKGNQDLIDNKGYIRFDVKKYDRDNEYHKVGDFYLVVNTYGLDQQTEKNTESKPTNKSDEINIDDLPF